MVPHLEHKELIIVVVIAGVYVMGALIKFTVKATERRCVYIELTFAGLYALKPPVVHVSVADTSAVLIPSTTRSATTDSAGLPKLAALWALHLMTNH